MNLKRVRYKQRDFSLDDIDELKQINWNLEKYGCGPTSIANVLVNLGFKINPIDTAKKILYDRNGNFDNTYLRNKGINSNGIIYCLERLIKENKINISYKIVKIDFSRPNDKKEKIISLFNFSDHEQMYELKLPGVTSLKELLNSNLEIYGGTQKRKSTVKTLENDRILLTLPPFSAVYYAPEV